MNAYEFICTLGRGAYGEVVLARNRTTGAEVAIKCYSKHRLLKVRDVARVNGKMKITTALDKVHNEIRIHRLLGAHPRVARLLEVLSDQSCDDFFLGMQPGWICACVDTG